MAPPWCDTEPRGPGTCPGDRGQCACQTRSEEAQLSDPCRGVVWPRPCPSSMHMSSTEMVGQTQRASGHRPQHAASNSEETRSPARGTCWEPPGLGASQGTATAARPSQNQSKPAPLVVSSARTPATFCGCVPSGVFQRLVRSVTPKEKHHKYAVQGGQTGHTAQRRRPDSPALSRGLKVSRERARSAADGRERCSSWMDKRKGTLDLGCLEVLH